MQGLTLAIGLIASIFFASYWLEGKLPRLVGTLVSAVAAAAAFFALNGFWQPGAFMSALVLGQLVWTGDMFLHGGHRNLLFALCLYAGADMIWLPMCLCGKAVWEIAVYFSLMVLCASLALLYTRYEVRRLNAPVSEKNSQYILVGCLPCTVLIPEGMLLTAQSELSVASAMLMGVAFLLLYCLLLWLQQEVIRRISAEELNRMMSRWQMEARDYMNTIRSQRHDFNLHVHALSGLIRSGEYDKCSQYLEKLVADTAAVNDIMPIRDAVVGSMLYNMREEARRKGSDIYYHITYDMGDIICNGFECNKIIGNLLQNAIDALVTPEDKAYGIRMSIFKRRGNTVITSENRFTGDPERIAAFFELGQSSKMGHEGIGLSMVMRTAQQYGGRIYPEFENGVIRFVVNIPNKVNLSPDVQEETV